MSKKMLMNATQHEENRVAIVEDGILTELDIEVAGHEPTKGNIYRAVVVRVESGLQAAFVDYGAGRLGFLQIDEINYKTVKPDYQPSEDGRRPRITDLLQRGQELLVQIIKEERGTKGAALTTYLSLAGRYMVVMPESKTRGVSRKAESDAQRKELKKAMSSIDMADNIGYIVRTAALNQTREELERDYHYLIRLLESIKELNQKVKAPALLYKESNLIIRSIRDYFTTDMDEVLIDDLQVFKEARDFFQMVMPDYAKLVKLHQERRPIFSRYQIEDQIETLNRNKVPLPSGGSIVIDPTEALVAIDVNSGKMASEQGVEATATKTNLEAAKEVGRQLRLRDLGGLVVIDFIDMRERKNAREVEKELKKSLENDKARVSVGRISQFGLLEMSRQRIKGVLAEGTYLPCPHCEGSGRLKSPETQAASLLRKIHASAAKGQVSKIDAQLPLEVAAYLLNNKREELVEMERDHHLQIHIHGNRDFLADQVELEITKKEKDKPAQPKFVAAGLLPVPAEDSAKSKNEKSEQNGDEDQNKKRRRRRRRKPATAEEKQAVADNKDQVDSVSSEAAEKEPAVKESDEKQEAPSMEQPEEAPKKRRPQRKKPAQTAPDKPADQAGDASQKEEQGSDADEKKPRPKRRASNRKPKAAQETPEAVGTAPAEAAVKTAESKPADQPGEDQPKARRPRRSPRKTETDTSQKSSTEKTPEAVKSADAQSSETEKKPVRRGRKPKTETADKPAADNSTKKTAETQEKTAEETTKPKRSRKPSTKKASPEKPAATESKADGMDSGDKQPAKKAPARRPRKAATTKENVKGDAPPTEEKPKPKRGRPRKKPAPPEKPPENS